MNITAVGMTYNIQPGNRRSNNIRFTGNLQPSQQDSFILSPFASIKRAILKKGMQELMNHLKDPDLVHFAATILVETIAKNGMRSLNQVLQSTESLTSEQVDHLRIIANKALKLRKPQVTVGIVTTLIETLQDPHKSDIHRASIRALSSISMGFWVSTPNPEITAGIAKALIENFQDPHKPDIQLEITGALSEIISLMIDSRNPETDEVLKTLAEALKNSDNPYVYRISPLVLGEMADRALKSEKPEIAYGLVKTLTETLKNSDDTQVHGDCTLALENIGKKALEIKNKPSIVPNTLIANSDEIVRLVISQLFKIATSPKLYKGEESSTFSRIDVALWRLKESAKIRGDIEYIEDCEKAIKDLAPYKEKVRKFDQAFKQENLDELDEDSKEKLHKDLTSTREKFRKMYDERSKSPNEYINQRYKKFLEYFENKEISKYIVNLRKHNCFPEDIIYQILKKMFSSSIVNAALEKAIKR